MTLTAEEILLCVAFSWIFLVALAPWIVVWIFWRFGK